MKIKVLIVDDHIVVRQGLQTLLGLDPELEIVGVASDGEEALERAAELSPDVVLMDLQMPGMDGFQATREIRARFPGIQVLALTSSLEHENISRALKAGAGGYLLKNMEAEGLRRAIKSASSSQVLLSPQAATLFVEGQPSSRLAAAPPEPSQAIATRANDGRFTPRENDVLQQLARGLSNKEIAYQLKLSEKTVKVHVSIIMAKLNSSSRTQAALHATRLGLVGNPPVTPVKPGSDG